MKIRILCLAFAVSICMASFAEAGRFGVFGRQPVRNTASVATHAVHGAVQGVHGGIAQAKAEMQARDGVMRHVGGSFGAGRFEGVGFSTVSADDAIHRCCYWGRKTVVEIGVARGARGFFATVIYR